MKKRFLALGLSLALIIMLGFGCATEPGPYTTQGTIIGGVLGAGTGAAIGSHNKHTGTGALIGGVTGALLGSVIGNEMDAAQQKKASAPPPPPVPPSQQSFTNPPPPPIVGPVTLEDVKAMSQQKVSDDTIINYIRQTRTVFRMTASSIIELKSAGVSEKVINYMIETPNLFTEPPPPPPPPPPVRHRHYDPWRSWW